MPDAVHRRSDAAVARTVPARAPLSIPTACRALCQRRQDGSYRIRQAAYSLVRPPRIVPRTVSVRRRMGVAYTGSSSRGFSRRAFYGLMTSTKQGCFGADTRRGEAERDPSHPIRVIPAREVSKSFVSCRAAFHLEGGCRRVLLPLHPQPPPRVSSLGTCVSLPYGKDPMTAQSSVLCLFCTHGARRGTHGIAALRKEQSA